MLIKNVKTLNASFWIWVVCTRWFLAGIISQAVEIARIGCSEEGFARLFDYWRSNWGYFPRVARKIGNQGHHVRTMAHLAHFLDSAIGTLLGLQAYNNSLCVGSVLRESNISIEKSWWFWNVLKEQIGTHEKHQSIFMCSGVPTRYARIWLRWNLPVQLSLLKLCSQWEK